MVRELKMKIMPTGPEDYISRFCSGLGLDADVEAKAYELIKAAQEKGIDQRTWTNRHRRLHHLHRFGTVWKASHPARGR